MVAPRRMAVKARHRNSVGVVDGLVDEKKKQQIMKTVALKNFILSNMRKRQSRQ